MTPKEAARARFLERFEELSRRFRMELDARLGAIEAGMDALLSGAAAPETAAELHRDVHKLAGAGAIFGFPAVTRAAQAFEETLAALPAGVPLGSETRAALLGRLEALRTAAAAAPPGETAPERHAG